ncbi:MAG: class I SAM-dependent methyltransferase [Nitrospirota bacterium]|nr:MAG: class I SAM-dependent methyltransferase [Nitrospirota bacterium]
MDSRELGLNLVQQLTGVEDLHYGFWDEDDKPSLLKFFDAQKRYSKFVFSNIKEVIDDPSSARVLDVGCGTGVMLAELLGEGYKVDGLIPAAHLREQVEKRLEGVNSEYEPVIYECKFEEFPESERKRQYDLVFFSESFQYIPMKESFKVLSSILKDSGSILICDFFRSVNHGDGGVGDKSFGGGHPIGEFEELIKEKEYTVLKRIDITKNVSPNIELVYGALTDKVGPALGTLDTYLSKRYPFIYKALLFFTKKKRKKLNYKYFSGLRNKETFERYKTYQLVVLGRNGL